MLYVVREEHTYRVWLKNSTLCTSPRYATVRRSLIYSLNPARCSRAIKLRNLETLSVIRCDVPLPDINSKLIPAGRVNCSTDVDRRLFGAVVGDVRQLIIATKVIKLRLYDKPRLSIIRWRRVNQGIMTSASSFDSAAAPVNSRCRLGSQALFSFYRG